MKLHDCKGQPTAFPATADPAVAHRVPGAGAKHRSEPFSSGLVLRPALIVQMPCDIFLGDPSSQVLARCIESATYQKAIPAAKARVKRGRCQTRFVGELVSPLFGDSLRCLLSYSTTLLVPCTLRLDSMQPGKIRIGFSNM
jgi:hypothetical protein